MYIFFGYSVVWVSVVVDFVRVTRAKRGRLERGSRPRVNRALGKGLA